MFFDDGERCAISTCARLDFLPLACTACGQRFCSTHGTPSAHSCSSTSAAVGSDGAPTRAFAFSCFVCNAKVAVELKCSLCLAVVCLAHREPSLHACSRGGGGGGASGASAPRSGSAAARVSHAAAIDAGSGAQASPQAALPVEPARRAQNDALRRKAALLALKMRCAAPRGIAPADVRYFETASCCGAPAAAGGIAAAALPPRKHAALSCRATAAHLLDAAAAAHGVRNPNAGEADPARRLHLWCVGPAFAAAARPETAASPILLPLAASLESLEREGLLQNGDTVALTLGCAHAPLL